MYSSTLALSSSPASRMRGKISLTFRSAVAAVAMAACVPIMTGCTPAQKATTLQVVTAINAKMPTIIAAADTVAATVAVILPTEGVVIGLTDTAFDVAANSLQAITASYIAAPNASTLAQIQTAINTLETQVNTATLSALGIKDTAKQQLAVAALKGLLTVLTVVFGLISPTESVSQLKELADTHGIQLARLRPYMDEGVLEKEVREQGASKKVPARIEVDYVFSQATAAGF